MLADDVRPSPIFLRSAAFDVATICFTAALLFLSLVSLAFVFHLLFRSRGSHHLQNFNALWSVRCLLVSLIALWSINELLRLPYFRQQYLNMFLPSLTLNQQSSLCKIHVVLSLGFLEPGFLVTLLFLVNVSIKKKTPRVSWAFVFVLATCLPILALQAIIVFFTKLETTLPEIFWQSYVVSKNTVLCMHPLMSSIIFGAFGIWYCIIFMLSCFKVMTLVINKGLRIRIYCLAFAVMIGLPLQILFLWLSLLWKPDQASYGAMMFLVFVSALMLAAAGEGILVIRPIADSLAAGGDVYLYSSPPDPEVAVRRQELEVSVQS